MFYLKAAKERFLMLIMELIHLSLPQIQLQVELLLVQELGLPK
jgi:hypothetical protein